MSPAMPDDCRYVSADVAAKRLGVSSATVRRRIRAGTLEGMIDTRPQGEVYLVLADALPPDSSAEEIGGKAQKGEETPPLSPDAPSTADAIRAAVEPLEKRLSVADNQLAAKDQTIREQAETIGRLRSDATHLTRQVTDLEARLAEREAELAAERQKLAEAQRAAGLSWWDKLRARWADPG